MHRAHTCYTIRCSNINHGFRTLRILCQHNSTKLKHTISPHKQFSIFQPSHISPRDIIYIPPHAHTQQIFGIAKTFKVDNDGHPCIQYTLLKPIFKIHAIQHDVIEEMTGTCYIPTDRSILHDEFLNPCYKVHHTQITIKPKFYNGWTTGYLLLTTDSVRTPQHTYCGPTTPTQLQQFTTHFNTHVYMDETGTYYSDDDISHTTVCHTCQEPHNLLKCTTHENKFNTTAFFHQGCTD